jgi:histidinol-phosphate aminotransferase
VNALSAAAAKLLLDHHQVLQGQADRIVADRAALERGLDGIAGLRRFASAANFVLVRVDDRRGGGAPAAFEALKAGGILVKNLHGSHPQLAHCLRLTVGTSDENRRLLAALPPILHS